MYDWLEDQYGVIRDMFPYPRPAGYDALKAAFPVDACPYINSDFLDGTLSADTFGSKGSFAGRAAVIPTDQHGVEPGFAS